MKLNWRSWRLWLALSAAVCVSAALGIAIAAADSGVGTTEQANTAGVGGHQRPITAAAAAVSAGQFSATEQAVLAAGSSSSVKLIGSVGSGDQVTKLYSVTLPNGASCAAASHQAGTIVEPLNCHSNAYLRLWDDSSGSGDPAGGAIASTRLIVLASAEVQSVRVVFSDGSSESLVPNANGVVAVQTTGSTTPAQVIALDNAGNTLASLGA